MKDKIRAVDYEVVNNSLDKLEKVVLDTLDFNQVIQKVVDSMLFELDFLNLGYRIMVLSLIDERKKVLRRVSISQTEEAEKATGGLPMPFQTVEIPLSSKNNICIRTMEEKKSLFTHNWNDILTPPLSKEEAVALQAKVGIKTSLVYPLIVREKPIGMMIFSMVKSEEDLSPAERMLLSRFVDIVALAVQNSRLYSSVEKTSDKLKKANNRLKELDRLKDEFVSVASHELRTPMTAVKSYLWMSLHKGGQIDAKTKNYLEIAYISTERLLKLVQDMLTISRIEGKRLEIDKQNWNLYDLALGIISELKIKAEELKIGLTISSSNSYPVFVDKDKIKEVFQNIIGNALKFTPPGGQIQVNFKIVGSTVEVAISDTGPGLSKEDVSKLFQKFGKIAGSYIKANTNSGTGLGLFICKQIVNLHQGKIWVDSTLGKGTTFTFSLPLSTSKGGENNEK